MKETFKRELCERLRNYLSGFGYSINTITQDNDSITINFMGGPDSLKLSDEQKKVACGLILRSDPISVDNFSRIIQCDADTPALSFCITNYGLLYDVYKLLKRMHVCITGFEVGTGELAFSYILPHRNTLTYDELEEIQNIINPSIRNHDSIRVMGFDGEYTLRAVVK